MNYRTQTNMTENSKFKKTFVEDELPDQTAVSTAGIDLPLAEARLVLMLASRVISHGQSQDRGAIYVAARFIYLIVSARVRRPAGESLAPLITDGAPPRIWDDKTALRRLGLESSDISALWDESSTFPTSCLPLQCVLGFLPAEVWPVVAAFIGCSADELSPRIDEALRRHGQQAGPAPLRNDLTRLSLVMRTLVTLRRELRAGNESRSKRERPLLELPAALDAWTALPAMPTGRDLDAKSKGGRGRRDVSAVPPELIHGRSPAACERSAGGSGGRSTGRPAAIGERSRNSPCSACWSQPGRASATSACSMLTTSTPPTSSRMAPAGLDCDAAVAR
jgi:hypothetical protein